MTITDEIVLLATAAYFESGNMLLSIEKLGENNNMVVVKELPIEN